MFLTNSEQRTHLAGTLRLVGVGLFVPVISKALIGTVDISQGQTWVLGFTALLLEVEALLILGGSNDD